MLEEKIRRIEAKIKTENYFHWVERHWTSRGEQLDFEKHKYLVQIYQDQSQIIYYMKSAQVGMTERMLTEAVWLPDQFKENSVYFFPTSGTASDLVQERIDEPFNNSEYLRMVSGRAKKIMGKQADKVGLKRMSRGFLYFRGSNNPSQITSVSGDVIFVDEVDRMLPESVPYFEKRLSHSERRWQRWGSTPTIPNYGIHKLFLDSDQQEYEVKCGRCGEWQALTLWDNVIVESCKLTCKKCREEIVPWQSEGKWVARNPSSDKRGYHISQLYSPRLDLAKLIENSQKTAEWEVQQFYNQDLGIPYEPKGSKIVETDLDACKRDYLIPLKKEVGDTFMGIDVGLRLHIIIKSKKRILFIGDRKDFEDVGKLINEYNCKVGVIDALPETRKAQELASKFIGRIYLCYYSGLKEVKKGEWWKKEPQKVNTDRTISLDMTFDEIKNQKIEMPKNLDDYPDFKNHLKNLIRVVREEKGNKIAEYIQTGDDHYAHATNYANLAEAIFEKIVVPEAFTV